jgi:hypothetical protein
MKEGITPAKHPCTRIVSDFRSTKLICADAKNAKSNENCVVVVKCDEGSLRAAAEDKEKRVLLSCFSMIEPYITVI